MRTLQKVLMGSLVLLMVISLFFYLQVTSPSKNTELGENESSSIPWDSLYGPAPFDLFANIVPLDEAVSQLAERGLMVYLPTNLSKFRLMAVYAVVQDGKVGNTIMLVYSNSGDSSIRSAELIVEITPLSEIPYQVTDSSRARFIGIDNWTVFVCERAPVGFYEYYKKYGTEYAILLDLVIGGLNYEFRFSPILSLEDAIHIVSSMRETNTGSP